MSGEKESFNKLVLLTGARVLGILFSIAIPMYLGRTLSVETYGTYKQLMLFFWFSQVALSLGIDDSAFYFMRWEPKKFSLYCFNALVFNLLITGFIWLCICFFKSNIAFILKNPEIEQYLPVLGLLILTTVASMQIEGIFIAGLNRFNERLVIEIGMELLKSIFVISSFYYFHSVHVVLWSLSILMGLRLSATIYLIHSQKTKEGLFYKDGLKYLMSQVKFGIPLGVSRVFQNILNMENFFISSYFSLIQFTYYSVGCFENPIVNAARSSMSELANLEMTIAMKDGKKKIVVEIWRSMSRKLFMIIIPFVIYMIFFAKELITFIFSSKYLASIPFFMVFNLYLIVGALNPEPFFRVTKMTFLALKIKIAGLVIGIALLVAGARYGGPLYALAGKILGVFIMNVAGLGIGAKLLGFHFLQLFQWRDLGGVLLISLLLSGLMRVLFWNSNWAPFWILAASFSLYTLMHFILSSLCGLLKKDELLYLKDCFYKAVGKGQTLLNKNKMLVLSIVYVKKR